MNAWGEAIGRSVGTPVVICLRGELGAGKSVLARAVARGAGVRGHIPSPTYNLVLHYTGERAKAVNAGDGGGDGDVEPGNDGEGGEVEASTPERVEVAHLDLFRLDDPDEVWELGWRELGERDGIVLVEWPDRAEELLQEPRWEVRLRIPDAGSSLREIAIKAVGAPHPLPAPGQFQRHSGS